MVDPVDLEVNVLEFLRKSFMFARRANVGERELAVFQRTETESESRFRPKILRLYVAVPSDWVIYDLAADLLLLGREGRAPAPRATGTALEAGAEAAEFDEQGLRFRRHRLTDGWVYLPVDLEEAPARLATTLAALGLSPAAE